MKIAICLIIKDENDYLKEWLDYYRNLGIDQFIIYDNDSKIPIKNSLRIEEGRNKDCKVIQWSDDEYRAQNRAYEHCIKNNKDFDYIGFFDTDEFIIIKDNINIKQYIENLTNKYGKFDGLGIYWRMYGKTKPYYTERQPIENYTEWSKNPHIKSFLNPKKVIGFPDPHKATMIPGSKYIDELGRIVVSPLGEHTSENIWIKHIWTRSLPEFEEKIKRGTGDGYVRNIQQFYEHNDNCLLKD